MRDTLNKKIPKYTGAIPNSKNQFEIEIVFINQRLKVHYFERIFYIGSISNFILGRIFWLDCSFQSLPGLIFVQTFTGLTLLYTWISHRNILCLNLKILSLLISQFWKTNQKTYLFQRRFAGTINFVVVVRIFFTRRICGRNYLTCNVERDFEKLI